VWKGIGALEAVAGRQVDAIRGRAVEGAVGLVVADVGGGEGLFLGKRIFLEGSEI